MPNAWAGLRAITLQPVDIVEGGIAPSCFPSGCAAGYEPWSGADWKRRTDIAAESQFSRKMILNGSLFGCEWQIALCVWCHKTDQAGIEWSRTIDRFHRCSLDPAAMNCRERQQDLWWNKASCYPNHAALAHRLLQMIPLIQLRIPERANKSRCGWRYRSSMAGVACWARPILKNSL